MPQEIKLSQLQDRDAFEQAVAAHIAALTAFSKQVGVPRPTVHPMVEACIQRISYPKADKKPDEYVADYVIVDDTPPPPPPLSLQDRKSILFHQLRQAEQAAIEKVAPQLKRRLMVLKYSMARGKPEDERSPEDKQTIEEYEGCQKIIAGIEIMGATAEAALEDVTDDTIDSWQPPNFG